MILSLFNIVALLSSFLTIILSLFFIFTNKGNKLQNNFLAILLILFNLQIIYAFTISNYSYQYFIKWHKIIYILKQTSFLTGPVIYLYINNFLNRKNTVRGVNLFHFTPFLIALVILGFLYIPVNHFVIWKSKIDLYDTIFILSHNLTYIVLCIYSLKALNISFKGFYQSIRKSTYITWLQFLLIGYITIWIVNLNSFAIIMILRKPGWCSYTQSIFGLSIFIFINAIMFIILLKPEILYIIQKYKSNNIDEAEKQLQLQKLVTFMKTERPYLNPDISLESLSNAVLMSPRHLSQIINEFFKKNFKGYILEYRIKESMEMLSNPKYRELTVLEILYKSGFNTKSVFNYQFKLYTGLTPQEYRSKFLYC
jgi:AraC-like DNA-binding protein